MSACRHLKALQERSRLSTPDLHAVSQSMCVSLHARSVAALRVTRTQGPRPALPYEQTRTEHQFFDYPEKCVHMAAQERQDAATRALIGLLVHSAADGFAVGASSVSTSASLSFLVAVAMVLHKVA